MRQTEAVKVRSRADVSSGTTTHRMRRTRVEAEAEGAGDGGHARGHAGGSDGGAESTESEHCGAGR